LTSHIQNVGHVGVDGVADVDGAGLRIGHFKLHSNFQIALAGNARPGVVQGGHETFLVDEIAAQRNVHVREGGIVPTVLNGTESDLLRIGVDSKHGKQEVIGELLENRSVVSKSSKIGFLDEKVFVVKAKVKMLNAMILEDVLIRAAGKIVSARRHLFVEAKDQNGLGEINVFEHNLVSGRTVRHGIDHLETSDAGKFHPRF